MDLKQYKPVHLKCPKCGYDYSCSITIMIWQFRSLIDLGVLNSDGCKEVS